MPTRTGYGAPQLPHRPQHKPRPEQNQALTPNRPHAAEPTRKALVTRESYLSSCFMTYTSTGNGLDDLPRISHIVSLQVVASYSVLQGQAIIGLSDKGCYFLP